MTGVALPHFIFCTKMNNLLEMDIASMDMECVLEKMDVLFVSCGVKLALAAELFSHYLISYSLCR